jgi:hypothetical protein
VLTGTVVKLLCLTKAQDIDVWLNKAQGQVRKNGTINKKYYFKLGGGHY